MDVTQERLRQLGKAGPSTTLAALRSGRDDRVLLEPSLFESD
jgi:hypothetical protein